MKIAAAAALALTLAACSMSSKSASVSSADVTTYDQAALDVSTSAGSYRAAASSMGSVADCQAVVQQYAQHVRPDLDRMGPLASRMDDYLKSMGQMSAGDMTCGVEVMSNELAQHVAVACTLPDMAANRAEALRHCDAMEAFVDHMRMRADETGSVMGVADGGMMGGGMGPGMMTDGGWIMPDGGVMGFDHEMPGCTFADGGFSTGGGYPTDGGWMMDGGARMDGGSMMDAGTMMDAGSMMDAGTMMDGGMMMTPAR